MFTRIFLTGLLAILLSCKKENNTLPEGISATELLTRKPWILASHGLDENSNDKIDPLEEGTRFFLDGTGLFDDNTISCGTGIDNEAFAWALTDNETGIDFRDDSVKILQLNEQELLLYKELVLLNNETVKMILTYRH